MRLRVGTTIDPKRMVGERWFAAKDRAVTAVTVEERFAMGRGGLAILRADVSRGRSLRYTLPLDDDPSTWLGLADLAQRGGSISGDAGGVLVGMPPARPAEGTGAGLGGDAGAGGPTARPLGVDQSNTSWVIGERSVMKLYRRLESGPNPEVELAAALVDAPIPAFHGAIRYRGAAWGPANVAIVQQLAQGAGDEFERLAEQLAAWLRAGCPQSGLHLPLADLADAGRAVAELHAALLRLEGRHLRPRPAGAADSARWSARARYAATAAIRVTAPADPALAAELRAIRPAIESALLPLAVVAPGSTVARIHGDLSVAQLIRDGARFLIVDLEGEPTRPVAERRRRDTLVRDLASLLRSIDHITRSAIRRSGVHDQVQAIDGWLDAARHTFLDAYRRGLAAEGVDVAAQPRLLHALEVEKELYEFVYAAMYLPPWRYAPAAGLRWLLQRGAMEG